MLKKMLIVLLMVMVIVTGCGKKAVQDSEGIDGNSKKMIITSSLTEAGLVILSDDNKLYAYGSILGDEILDKPKVLASNVKDFFSNRVVVLYTDLDDNLYGQSTMPSIGEGEKFTKLASNVDEFRFCGIDGIMVLDNSKNYYMQVSSTGSKHCGVKDAYQKLTKVDFALNNTITNLGSSVGFSSFLLSNGDLYEADVTAVREGRAETYIKVLSNVKKINDNYILTNNNEIYYMNDYGMGNRIDMVATNGKEIYNGYYQTDDNKFHSASYNNQGLYVNDIDKKDIKEIIYCKDSTKLVYLDTNNKLVLSSDEETKKVAFDPSSMKEIYNFIK